MNYPTHNFNLRFGWPLLLALLCLTGCRTTDQADSGDAVSVKISGHTEAEIQQAAARAFLANHYEEVNDLVFEKKGTRWDKVDYGGWSSNPVWIRMKLKIISHEDGVYTLAGNIFAVVDRNDATMEEEKPLSVAYGSECKKILDEAKAALNAASGKNSR